MIKTATLLTGTSLEALEKVCTTLKQPEVKDMDALQLYAWMYRAGAVLDVMRAALKGDANEEFLKLSTANPNLKSWEPVNFAKITKQPNPTSWTFPAELVDREARLKSDKNTAKETKTATKHTGTIDPEKNVTFKVSLYRC